MKTYNNLFHAINSMKKQGLEISSEDRFGLEEQFFKAGYRSELPLSETFVKSYFKNSKTENLNKQQRTIFQNKLL